MVLQHIGHIPDIVARKPRRIANKRIRSKRIIPQVFQQDTSAKVRIALEIKLDNNYVEIESWCFSCRTPEALQHIKNTLDDISKELDRVQISREK